MARGHTTKVLVGLVGAFLIISGSASAGTKEQPEMRCPANNVYFVAEGALRGPMADAIDMRGIWFDHETVDSVRLNLHLADTAFLEQPFFADFSVTYHIEFSTSNVHNSTAVNGWGARAMYSWSVGNEASWSFRVSNGTSPPVHGGHLQEEDSIFWELPRKYFEGPRLNDTATPLWAVAYYLFKYPIDGPVSDCEEDSKSYRFQEPDSSEPNTADAGHNGSAPLENNGSNSHAPDGQNAPGLAVGVSFLSIALALAHRRRN